MFLALLCVLGCDDTALDPFVESAFNYSIFGYLDAGADTQFVRVTPVRDSIALGFAPLNATVTLEHLASGRQMMMHDSLFRYQTTLARFPRPAHNFWTTEPLEPLATYRLTVTRSDGATSYATVTLPDTFPDPVIFVSDAPSVSPSTITVSGVERLADVRVVYRVRSNNTSAVFTHTISYLNTVVRTNNGLVAQVDQAQAGRIIFSLFGDVEILDITVTVAAAGPDWPDLTGLDPETLALPNIVSNVEEGVGYLGGVASKTIPWPGF